KRPAKGGASKSGELNSPEGKTRLTEQRHNHTGHLTGLFQHGDTRLHQHGVFAHVGAFAGEVSIQDAAFSHLSVVFHVGQVVGGVVQTVDVCTEVGTQATNRVKCRFQKPNGSVCFVSDHTRKVENQ